MRNSMFLLAGLFAVNSAACGGAGAGDADSQDLVWVDLDSYLMFSRADPSCEPSSCSDYFVKSPFGEQIKCVDGKKAAECHVADLRLPEIAESDAAYAAFEKGTAIVRGRLASTEKPADGRQHSLIASEVWIGASGTKPEGKFYTVINRLTGASCEPINCPNLEASELGVWKPTHIQGVNLDATGVDDATAKAGQERLLTNGLLVAGTLTRKMGLADGFVNVLAATEFYTQAVPLKSWQDE